MHLDDAAGSAQDAVKQGPMSLTSSIEGERPLRLYAYWNERRGDREFPSRADIDPLQFKYALGSVSLVECLGDPPRFRYRVVSSSLTLTLGYEMTGRCTEEIPEPDVRAYVEALYQRAIDARKPLYEAGTAMLDGRRWHYRSLVLPLSSDGVVIDMLLVYREAAAVTPSPDPNPRYRDP